MSDAPWPYPDLCPLAEAPEIRGLFCYVVRHYGRDGLLVVISRDPAADRVGVSFHDWAGNRKLMTLAGDADLTWHRCLNDHVPLLINVMRQIGVLRAQFFFAVLGHTLTLVDFQISEHKMAGPGMLRDVFAKVIPTQEVVTVENMTPETIEAVAAGTGVYEGDLILKPSRFRQVEVAGAFRPLYVEVRRQPPAVPRPRVAG